MTRRKYEDGQEIATSHLCAGERVFDVPDAHFRAVQQNPYHIEPVILVGQAVAGDPHLSGAAQLSLLSPIDGFDRVAEGSSAPRFDLDERDNALVLRDYVYVAVTVPKTSCPDAPPFPG